METNVKTSAAETKALLSSLWIFYLLNMIFRDIHEIAKPEFLAEMMTRSAIPEELFLVAGIVLEIPIALVVLSRMLNYRVNRWANIIAPVLMGALAFTNPPGDLDDIFFLAVEIVGLAVIAWTAWNWRNPEIGSVQSINK